MGNKVSLEENLIELRIVSKQVRQELVLVARQEFGAPCMSLIDCFVSLSLLHIRFLSLASLCR